MAVAGGGARKTARTWTFTSVPSLKISRLGRLMAWSSSGTTKSPVTTTRGPAGVSSRTALSGIFTGLSTPCKDSVPDATASAASPSLSAGALGRSSASTVSVASVNFDVSKN